MITACIYRLIVIVILSMIAGCTRSLSPTPAIHSVDTLRILPQEPDIQCNASANSTQAQFIIGYGSLMQDESRMRTAAGAGTAFAVDVQGFRRGWFTQGASTGFSTTFLGAVADTNHGFNAVMFGISHDELVAMDRRERGYCRSPVMPAALHLAGKGGELPDGQYWIYLNTASTTAIPSSEKPLVQSYIDIFLGGCLEQEERYNLKGFAGRCISTTSNWSKHWVNDRLYPRRPFIHQPRAGQIDRLLDNAMPEYFRQIVIE